MINVQLDVPKSGGTGQLHVRAQSYIARCEDITDAPEGEFGKNMDWWWALYNTGDTATDLVCACVEADGETPWRFRDRTSTKFGKNPKSGMTAKARQRVEALLKMEIDTDAEDFSVGGLLDQCIHKWAVVHIVEKNGYLNIQHVEPYRKGMLVPLQPLDDASDESDGLANLPF
jgi:hypothetical protein